MYKEVKNINDVDALFSILTLHRMKVLMLMKRWMSITEACEALRLSRGGLFYHVKELEKNGYLDSRLVKYGNVYRREYKTKPLMIMVDFNVSRNGKKAPEETGITDQRDSP